MLHLNSDRLLTGLIEEGSLITVPIFAAPTGHSNVEFSDDHGMDQEDDQEEDHHDGNGAATAFTAAITTATITALIIVVIPPYVY